MLERLPPPWTVRRDDDAYWVEDASGQKFAFVYFRLSDPPSSGRSATLSEDLARRIAGNVARLPDLLRALRMIHWRQQNSDGQGF